MVMISRDHLPRQRALPMSSDISALIAEDACVNPYAASACSNPAGGDGAVCPFGSFGRVSFISARYSTRQSTPRAGIGQPRARKHPISAAALWLTNSVFSLVSNGGSAPNSPSHTRHSRLAPSSSRSNHADGIRASNVWGLKLEVADDDLDEVTHFLPNRCSASGWVSFAMT